MVSVHIILPLADIMTVIVFMGVGMMAVLLIQNVPGPGGVVGTLMFVI